MGVWSPLRTTAYVLAGTLGAYLGFVALLTIPFVQNQVVYLNAVKITWFKDLRIPEQWGFLHNQVTPFTLQTPDGETLHAWHVLPLGLYQKHEEALLIEPDVIPTDINESLGFRLLRDDPDSLLVLCLHGAAGTLGAGWRPPSYRSMSAASSNNIHIVTIDYRGYGDSTGTPSEEGLLIDALTLAKWAMEVARIPPSRIVIFGQSLGTAVSISLAHHLANQPEPVVFSGTVLVAPFVDAELLTATYRIGGIIPLLDPLAYFPPILRFLNTFLISKWPSKDKLAEYISRVRSLSDPGPKYHINIIHAEDDYDIPWSHSDKLYWHAVNAASPEGVSFEDLEKEKLTTRQILGAGVGGWVVNHETEKGLIREEIVKYGLHDEIMTYPVVSLAILRAFQRRA